MNSIPSRQIFVILFWLITVGGSGMAHGIEEPQHTLVERIGNVEIRHYPAVIQAVTPLKSSSYTSEGFRRLAGFIFGGNDGGQKIAMTAPVQETLDSEQPELAFTMPSGYSMMNLPSPDDPGVRLVEVPAREVAVISFSGWATASKIERYTRRLMEAISEQRIVPTSEPMLNQYNPPWTPPFLRRNEIMVEVGTTRQAVVKSGYDVAPARKTISF